MSDIEIIKVSHGILWSISTVVLFFFSFKVFYKFLIQEKKCTAKTKGIVKRYISVFVGRANSGVRLPVVYYYVNNKEYSVTGPLFKSYTHRRKTASTPQTNAEMEFYETAAHGLIIKRNFFFIFPLGGNPMRILYPEGSLLDVYYDPLNPKLSYVVRYCGFKWLFWLLFITAMVTLLSDLFVLFWL